MHSRLKRNSVAVLAVAWLACGTAWAQNVYRWTDDSGKIHYTKTLPPEASDRPYDILSPSGIVVRRVTDPTSENRPEETAGPKKPIPLYTEPQKRLMADRLLLLKYSSEQEILDAMQVEVDQLKYDQQIIDATRASVMESLMGEIHAAANRQRAGMPVDDELRQKINRLRKRLAGSETASQKVIEREQEIRARFSDDLERFRRLQTDSVDRG